MPSKLDNRDWAIIRLGKVNGGKHHQRFELVGKENHPYEIKCKEFLQIEESLSLLSQRFCSIVLDVGVEICAT